MVGLAGDVALQAADGFSFGQALGLSLSDVRLGSLAVP